MKRRSFLAMLGLAPVAAVPAVAAKPVTEDAAIEPLVYADGKFRMSTANIGTISSRDMGFAINLEAGTLTMRA